MTANGVVAAATAASSSGPPRRKTLIAMGNPLLDMVVTVDPSFLAEYKLTPGDGVLQGEEQAGLFERLAADFVPKYMPGGSGLNTARTFQALAEEPESVTYVGAIGDDDVGRILTELSTNEGLKMRLQVVPGESTGACAVLVCDKERTLCTSLRAALHLNLTDEHRALFAPADVCYVTAYLLSSAEKAVYRAASWCSAGSKVFAMNISTPYCAKAHKEHFRKLLPQVNILFGNVEEYIALARGIGIVHEQEPASPREEYEVQVCRKMLDFMWRGKPDTGLGTEHNGSKPIARGNPIKVAVMTRSHRAVFIAENSSSPGAVSFHKVPVPPVPESEIVDTNGAGDAFAGGFLAAFIAGQTLAKAALFGSRTAGQILRCQGFCTDSLCSTEFAKE